MISTKKNTTTFYFAAAMLLQIMATVTALSTRGMVAPLQPIDKNTGAWLHSLAHCTGGKTCVIYAAPTCEEAEAHGIDISSASTQPGAYNIQVMNAASHVMFAGYNGPGTVNGKISEIIPQNKTTTLFHTTSSLQNGILDIMNGYYPVEHDMFNFDTNCYAMTSKTQYGSVPIGLPKWSQCFKLSPNTGSSGCVVNLIQVAQMSTQIEKLSGIARSIFHTSRSNLPYVNNNKAVPRGVTFNNPQQNYVKCIADAEKKCQPINCQNFGSVSQKDWQNCLNHSKKQCLSFASNFWNPNLQGKLNAMEAKINNSANSETKSAGSLKKQTQVQDAKYKTLASTMKIISSEMDLLNVVMLGKTAQRGWNTGAKGGCKTSFGSSMKTCIGSSLKTMAFGELLGNVITPVSGELMTAISYGITDSKTYATSSVYVPEEFKSIHNFGSTQLNIAKVSGEFAGVDFGACLASSLVRLSGCEDTDDLDEDTDQTEESDLENAGNEMFDNVEEDSTDLESGELDVEAPEVEVEGAGDGVGYGVGDGVGDGVTDEVTDGVADGVTDGGY